MDWIAFCPHERTLKWFSAKRSGRIVQSWDRMGNLVRLKTWANKKNIERLYPNAPEIVAKLAKIAAEIAAHSAAPPSNAAVRAAGAQDSFREDRRIHRTIRGDMVRSKSELAIANILYGFEQQGRLKYFVEQPLPFANKPARWADFMIEARSDQWYWEHCGMLSDENYRLRWELKKALYEKNGYSVYSEDNVRGRLIVTEDGHDQGLDSQAIYQLTRKLFFN